MSIVQIPLWTIVTLARLLAGRPGTRSDSSMDDCNKRGPSAWGGDLQVQIPLWTIVTFMQLERLNDEESSDSSMDDCNLVEVLWKRYGKLFRFLYGRL